MRLDRRLLGAMLAASLAPAGAVVPAWGQQATPPAKASAPAGLAPGTIEGLPPLPPPVVGGVPIAAPSTMAPTTAGPDHLHAHGLGRGPIAGAVHHAGYVIKDRMIGEPGRFAEPPLGWSVHQNFAAQVQMANQHRFTLYRTDFHADSDRLTPDGLRRLGRMVARLGLWGGPLLIEVDPTRPGLAESRRLAVLRLAADHGTGLDPARLVLGGSPYYGDRGDLAGPYNGVLINRAVSAPAAYELNPFVDADFGN